MTLTLRRELRKKLNKVFVDWLSKSPAITDVIFDHFVLESEINVLVELLTDAALSVAGIAKATDETSAEYNVALFRGEFTDYPEHLWKIAECLRDTWKFVLPEKPRKGNGKGKYAFFCTAMNAIKDACAEFGVDALVKVHEEWRSKFRDGIAPYTVAQPTSLINVCAGKARELREQASKPEVPMYKPLVEDANVYVPNPNPRRSVK